MSDTLGDIANCNGESKGLGCHLYGKIHMNNTWARVKESGVKLVRFGGEHADENMPTRRQYLQMIDSTRSKGMEPLLQIPYNNNYYTADTAAALLKFINITMKRNVKYWSIGNEPDVKPPNGYGYYTASPIADYIRQFATRLKAIDSTIITLGPELSYYNDKNKLISELTSPGGYYDITGKVPGHSYYYLDIITFHSYPFGGQQKREELISNLKDPWHISNMLDQLNRHLDSCNLFHKRTGKNALKIALTETNLNFRNSPDPDLGAHSFIAGQFWCELMGVGLEKGVEFISFWSIIENSLGYIDEKTGKLWPTYYHYRLAAENFKGNYYKSHVDESAKELKTIVTADSGLISVMILNQKNKKSHYRYTVQIGNGKVSGLKGVQIGVKDLNLLKNTLVYHDSIEDESTSVLVFNYSGQLVKKFNYRKKDSAPKLVKETAKPIYVSVSPDMKVVPHQEVWLTANTNVKNAEYKWYEGESSTPINIKSMNTCKIIPTKNSTYKLVVTCKDYTIEDAVNVHVID